MGRSGPGIEAPSTILSSLPNVINFSQHSTLCNSKQLKQSRKITHDLSIATSELTQIGIEYKNICVKLMVVGMLIEGVFVLRLRSDRL